MSKKMIIVFVLLFLSLISTSMRGGTTNYPGNIEEFPVLKGEYLGQKAPGLTPEMFAPGIISTKKFEFSGVFSPDGKEFYFTRRIWLKNVLENTIFVTKIVDGQWAEPQVAPFSGKYFDFEPIITPDGKRFYFGTARPFKGQAQPGYVHQWFFEKTEKGWANPKPMGPPFDSKSVMYPTATKKGTLYYTRVTEKSLSVYRSPKKNGQYQPPEKLSTETVNLFPYNAHPFIAPDESYLIFDGKPDLDMNTRADLYICFRNKDGSWTKAKNMGNIINTADEEMCAYVSPDRKYLFFSRLSQHNSDIYWIDAKIIENLKIK